VRRWYGELADVALKAGLGVWIAEPPEKAVEDSLKAVPPLLTAGCTCPEASDGPRPPHCRCDERAHKLSMKKRTAELVAGLRALRDDTDA
jgi:hypothetical protein